MEVKQIKKARFREEKTICLYKKMKIKLKEFKIERSSYFSWNEKNNNK